MAHHLLRRGRRRMPPRWTGGRPFISRRSTATRPSLRLLLSAEGSVEATDCCGVTPLAHAVTGGHCACARILLAAGATTTALFPGEICTAADLKGVLSTDANLTAYSSGAGPPWNGNGPGARFDWNGAPSSACAAGRRSRPSTKRVTGAASWASTRCAQNGPGPRGTQESSSRSRSSGAWASSSWAGSALSSDATRSPATASATTRSRWGVDGIRLKKWAGGDTPYRTARKWRDGDVIGCAADLARGDLSFALNGVWSGPDGVAFRGVAMPENGFPRRR